MARTRHERLAGLAWLPAVVFLAAAAGGCEDSAASRPPATSTPSTRPAEKPIDPELPEGVTDQTDAGMEILVKNPRPDRRDDEGAYRKDDKIPVGRLVGAVKWADPVIPRAEASKLLNTPLDLRGADRIPDPQPGETEYYENLKLQRPYDFVAGDPDYHPTGVVLIVRDVKVGRRDRFVRPTFMVRQGHFRPHILFSPLGDRVMFGTYDSYPTDLRMVCLATGRGVLQDKVSAFDRDTIKPLGGGGLHYTARPTMLQSEVLTEAGAYEIRGTRHLWKSAYVFALDNPYATVVEGPWSGRGRFEFADLPVGTWTIDVWHPACKPVQSSYTVTVRKDETTELAVLIHPPAFLRRPAEAAKP